MVPRIALAPSLVLLVPAHAAAATEEPSSSPAERGPPPRLSLGGCDEVALLDEAATERVRVSLGPPPQCPVGGCEALDIGLLAAAPAP